MAGRGVLTEKIKEKAKELLGYEITTIELRLMPYAAYVMVNENKIDIAKVNQNEREVLGRWREHGFIEGGAGGMGITKEFWDAINEIVWLGYVANEDKEWGDR